MSMMARLTIAEFDRMIAAGIVVNLRSLSGCPRAVGGRLKKAADFRREAIDAGGRE